MEIRDMELTYVKRRVITYNHKGDKTHRTRGEGRKGEDRRHRRGDDVETHGHEFHARPRLAHKNRCRGEGFQLSSLANRLFRTLFLRHLLA